MSNQNKPTPTEPPLPPSAATATSTSTSTSATTSAATATATATARASKKCAYCLHRRMRCSCRCVLAPYFPASKQAEFDIVNRVFNIKYVVELVKNAAAHDRGTAIATVIDCASRRAGDPLNGCCAVIKQLEADIKSCMAELKTVRSILSDLRMVELAAFLES